MGKVLFSHSFQEEGNEEEVLDSLEKRLGEYKKGRKGGRGKTRTKRK